MFSILSDGCLQANAKQRKGRAGRVRPGQVYKLYTQQKEESLSEYMMPEMLRSGCILCTNYKKMRF